MEIDYYLKVTSIAWFELKYSMFESIYIEDSSVVENCYMVFLDWVFMSSILDLSCEASCTLLTLGPAKCALVLSCDPELLHSKIFM